MDEEVEIVESPRSAYIVRSRPTILSCKALNAQRVRFKCNSKWLSDDRHELQTGTDDSTQKPFQLVSVELTRQDVEGELADLGEYLCQCYAFGNQQNDGIQSDSAKIKIAYIRKHFYQTPVSDRVAEGQTIQLPCVPPDGDPKVEVYWHRNGQEIQTDSLDSNLILANDGSLIISATRLSDSANYTCEAKNLANRRITEPAELVVYVDGGWSSWASSQWHGNCAVDCTLLNTQLNMNLGDEQAIQRVLPSQRRTRACNNPAPLNGGSQCVGAEEEFRPCPHDCRIDGVWSRWSTFSECNSSCQRLRTRQCTAPAPSNGGLYCQGRDTEAVNCTDGILPPHCQQNLPPNSHVRLNNGDTSTSSFNGGQIYVLASLFCFAFLLVVITLLIAALFCRRRKTKSKTAHQYFPSVNDVHAVLLQQQKAAILNEVGSRDVKLMCTPPPAPYMQLLGPTNSMFTNNYTLKSNKSYASGYSHQRKFTGSRAALINNDHYSSSNSSSNSGSGATPIKLPLHHQQQFMPCAEDYATLYDCVPDKHTLTASPTHVYTCSKSLDEEEEPRRDEICCSLSEDDLRTHDQQGATIVAAQVDSDCSRIELRKCGAAVLLSDGTFPQTTMVFLAVSDDLQDRPALPPEETWLSSVVEFGKCENEGDEVILRRPAVITIEHYASIFPKENWQFCLYADYGSGWSVVTQLGDENINTPAYVQVERQRFHVMSDQFGRFLLAGKPKRPNVAPTKRVRLSAYATLPVMYEDSLITVRVYVVPDTIMAMENVRKQEAEQQGKLLSDSFEFRMQQFGDLCLCLEETEREVEFSEDGYTSPCSGVRYVEIPESRHLWCSQNGLHCNLSMNVPRRSSTIRVRLNASQRGSTAEKQTLHLQFDPFKVPSVDKCSSISSCEKLVSLDFQLGSDVKRQLSQLLDPPTESNNDWRGLAEILGFRRYLQFFGLRPGCSPTSLILDLFEAANTGSDCAVLDLLQKLRIMGRQDAVLVLERFLATPFDY